MQILFTTVKYSNNTNSYQFCPSFKMKMGELKDVDRFVAKKYNINPQQCKTITEFQIKCKDFIEKAFAIDENGNITKDFFGRREEAQIERKEMIKEWYNYVTKENDSYTSAIQLMILKAITKYLKPNEDTLPPVLNKGVLANTVMNAQNRLRQDENTNLNFDKEYRLNLQKSMLEEETALDESLNGWIIIPSKEHDPENFETNVDKLKMFSHNDWCTKSYAAEPYLNGGDFHVYMEKGKPKLAVRFNGDKVTEIEGEKNNRKIPYKYHDVALSYLKNYKLDSLAEHEIKAMYATKAKVEEFLKKFPNGINNYPPEEILEEFGIKCKKDNDGLLIISHYKANMVDYSLSDFGVDENRLFKYIKKIEENASFVSSDLTDLGSLQYIGGNVDFGFSQITSTGNLQYIGKGAYFDCSKITDFGCLKSYNIGGEIYFNENEKSKNIWIETVRKQFPDDIKNATTKEILEQLGIKYKQDDDGLFIISDYKSNKYGFNFSDLGIDENKLFKDIKRIEGDADFAHSSFTSLGSLQYIGGNAIFYDSQITDLGDLEYIGGRANFNHSKITSPGKLKYIGKKLRLDATELKPSDFASVEVKGVII